MLRVRIKDKKIQGEIIMQIKFIKETEKLIAVPEGRIDTATAIEFEKKLVEHLDDVSDIVIDMTKVEYVSSAGLRVFLKVQKLIIKQGKMKLIGVNENVKEVFEITGFSKIINIE
jgi:anti-sigma B factor antagonist